MIAALYVEANGCYSGLPGVEPWDAARDARRYRGPWPVVAHPPCSRWCRLAGMIETRYGYERGDDDGTFLAALTAVRTYGGVLEHPAYSAAWAHFGLPVPPAAGWQSSFTDAGYSAEVEQGWYGHPLRKPTWLYTYGIDPMTLPPLQWGRGPGGQLAHRNGLSKSQRQAMTIPTPAAFRDVLLDMARRVPLAAAA